MAQTRGRKKSNTKRTTTRKNSKRIQQNYSSSIVDEVMFLISLGVTILLFLCNFHLIGSVGDKISNVMFGIFGIMAYVAPLLIFLAVYFGISNVGNKVAVVKLFSGIVFSCMCCVLFTLFGGIDDVGDNIKAYYSFSHDLRKGGGVIGGFLGNGMHQLVGTAGTVIIMLLLMIVSFILLTEKSFISFVKKVEKAFMDSAKNDVARRKDQSYERMQQRELKKTERAARVAEKAEQEKRRMDKKVSGVTPNLTLADVPFEDAEPENTLRLDEPEFKVDSDGQIAMEALSKIKIRGIDDTASPEANAERTFGTEIGHKALDRTGNEPVKNLADSSAPDTPVKKPVARTASAPASPTSASGRSASLSTAEAESQEFPATVEQKPFLHYKFPPVSLLSPGAKKSNSDNGKQLRETALRLQQTLHTFGVNVTITDISQGPAVTRYELQPEVGVKVSKIVNLADDIKLNLAATDIRIEAPIPGKAAVGIEVPNAENSAVAFRDLLESREFTEFGSKLAFAVGKDIAGKTIVADIAKMPHLLIAGATGSGKSVCINTIIMSLLYKAKPDEVKLIMIDPKVVELSVYNGIPHLMVPVVTDPKKAAAALHWGVAEMTDRYKKFADMNVRDLKGYNKKVGEMTENNGQPIPEKLPQIVIIVDELADLMMVAPGEVEESICRLAQLARAAGIHLIIATQRPSVDVITGLIKANMPSRVAFAVSSGVDSRTILDMNGAEKLLGKGDMLFYPQGVSKPSRIQGAFVSDKEVSAVVDFIKQQFGELSYTKEMEEKMNSISAAESAFTSEASDRDSYFIDAGKFIIEKEKASIGMLQRVFKIGFNRAARIMDQLEEVGVVGPEEGTKPRRVLMSEEQFEQLLEEES